MSYQICQQKGPWWILIVFHLVLANQSCGDAIGEPKVSRRSEDAVLVKDSQTERVEVKDTTIERNQTHQHPSEEKAPKPSGNLSLAWGQTIKAKAIGIPTSSKAHGKTLEEIVAGQAAGRDDGQLCSACHNREDAQGGYGLDVGKNGSLTRLDPWEKVGTKEQRAWAGKSGWVSRFIQNKTKPPALKAVMRAWLAGGFKEDKDH